MREIKFRAWEFKKKEWHYFDLNTINCHPDASDKLNYEHWTQYTGLHDKNGKEIWEGDIVRGLRDFYNEGNPKLDVPFTDVVTMERFPCYWLKNEEFGYEGECLIRQRDCEVIGNIYENPELLGESLASNSGEGK